MSRYEPVSWWFWLYQPYKWLVFLPLMLVNSIVCALLAALFAIFISPRAGSFWGMAWARITCWLTPIRLEVQGKENIRPGQSYVVAANHQTGFDIFILYGYLGIDFKWIMKKELRRIPFIGYASEKVGHIFIDRSSPRAALKTLQEAKRKLEGGSSVVIFPEGTRSKEAQMHPFKRGAFKLAFELDLPILPVTIVDSWRIKRDGFFNIVPGKAALIVHPSINICDYKDRPGLLSEVTQQIIEKSTL
jgi:1-acyl-sn-glycerol-3-phosphate acyltransferase